MSELVNGDIFQHLLWSRIGRSCSVLVWWAKNPTVRLADTGRDEAGVYDELYTMKRAFGAIAMKLRTYHAHVLR